MYLSGCTQYVRTSVTTSTPSAVLFGVPQGSVLGPNLFVLYTANVLQLVKDHGLLAHAHADDTQILGVCRRMSPMALETRTFGARHYSRRSARSPRLFPFI